MSTQLSTGTALATLPRVNLMPPELGERKKLRQLQLGLVLVVVLVVAGVGYGVQQSKGKVASAKADVAAATAAHAKLQSQLTALSGVGTLAAEVASAESTLSLAKGSEVQWSHFLTDLSLTIPPNVWLTNVTMSQSVQVVAPGDETALAGSPLGIVTFNGTGALGHNDVAAWLDALAKQKGYVDPYLSNSTEKFIGDKKVADFTTTVNVTGDALSGRCAKPGVC